MPCPSGLEPEDRAHPAHVPLGSAKALRGRLALRANLITFLCPLAEHCAEQVMLASGQEARAGI